VLRRRPDAPLPALAAALRSQLRRVDHAGLFSDETLELALPEAGQAQALHLAEALSSALPGSGPLLCGIALCPDHAASADELLRAALTALRRASSTQPLQVAQLSQQPQAPRSPVLRSARTAELFDTIERLAGKPLPVLLLGETGTGKEVLANAVHQVDERRKHRLVAVNCASIPATLLESTLFGHERGAFTGADQQRRGVFEEAEGGTVFLDEIGELPAAAQAALLRVLETRRLNRVGSSKELEVDVRVVAATHRDLEGMCQEGKFRWDLFYRLNVVCLQLPPLRERPEEIAALAELFLQQARTTLGARAEGFDVAAMRALHSYSWPGNIRELRNAVERAAVIAKGSQIEADDLPERVRGCPSGSSSPSGGTESEGEDLKTAVLRFERGLIVAALRRANGSRAAAATALRVPLRTLAHKIKQLGISEE